MTKLQELKDLSGMSGNVRVLVMIGADLWEGDMSVQGLNTKDEKFILITPSTMLPRPGPQENFATQEKSVEAAKKSD